MSKQDNGETSSRRNFLKLATVSAPAALAAVAVSGSAVDAAEPDQNNSGLQDTAHTRAYFESAKF
ncbi:Formate dehydrogenase subunit or accessory protein [hydrothermal vent metagenome]|uniref:Formate dehydrogenase subunit or accessory protein n=1 Tax=hydrothermal vent metagenome TaxID=652676 RepID=A0A3B0RYA0_9ZZZZ